MPGISIFGIPGLPEITPGVDLAAMILEAAAAAGSPIESGDVVVVTSKIVSKAEGATVELADVVVSPFARQFAERWEKEPAVVERDHRPSAGAACSSAPRTNSKPMNPMTSRMMIMAKPPCWEWKTLVPTLTRNDPSHTVAVPETA